MGGVYIQIFMTRILDLATIYARDILLSVNLVTHMSISDVLVKMWNLRNFWQFFARQKLEVNKIGSTANRP